PLSAVGRFFCVRARMSCGVAPEAGSGRPIDQPGKIAPPPQFTKVQAFHEGLAAIWMDGKEGYIDKTGKVVIPPQIEGSLRGVGSFREGLANVQTENGGEWGYMDKTGRMGIPPEFAEAGQV